MTLPRFDLQRQNPCINRSSRGRYFKGVLQMEGMQSKLSILWIFATLNCIYCDVIGFMEADKLKGFLAGNLNGIQFSQAFLLGAGVLMEIPMLMVLLSRFLPYRANRWANILAGITMTAVQLGSLFISAPAPHYVFFSVIEIAATAAIVWYAWKWATDERALPVAPKVLATHP
jgi:uncharacterized protein DUF6326